MSAYHDPLVPGKVFHVFNHAVGDEFLFREEGNFLYFLEKYKTHIVPVCRTFSYALLPNHFHFGIQVRSQEELKPLLAPKNNTPDESDFSKYVMQQFSNLCNAYAKAYNKMYRRRGSLFIDYLRRKPVESATYFKHLILYHHYNAVLHDFCPEVLDYPFTSYHTHIDKEPTFLERDIVLSRFGGRDAFIKRHGHYNVKTEDFDFDL